MSAPSNKDRAIIVANHARDRALLVLAAVFTVLLIVGAFTYFVIHTDNGRVESIIQRFSWPGSWVVPAGFTLVLMGLISVQEPGLKSRLDRLYNLDCYIPLWWVALSASFWGALVAIWVPGVQTVLGLPEWPRFVTGSTLWFLFIVTGIAFISHVAFWSYWWWQSKGPEAPPSVATDSEAIEFLTKEPGPHFTYSSGGFLDWIENDEPVALIKDDRIGTRFIAARIAQGLQLHKISTHAIVGALGSGKSTICKFLKELTKETKEPFSIRVIQIELWQFLTADAALAGILNRMLDELALEINVFHLRTIPSQYIDVLESLPGFWESIVRSLRGTESDPVKVLERIDELATMLKLRLVVWIDDLERFAGTGGQGYLESIEGSDRLSPIRALLHALGEQQSITVVVATTSLASGFDWDKIARHIHEIPRLGPEKTGPIFHDFRESCLVNFISPSKAKNLGRSELSNAWIDPTPDKFREQFQSWQSDEGQFESIRSSQDLNAFLTPSLAMALLCQTPRALKQSLRRAEHLWRANSLRGECQFEQLLALCLLRDGCAKGFAILRDHWPRLKSNERHGDARFYMAQRQFEGLINKEGATVDGPRLRVSGDPRLDISIESQGSNVDKPALRFFADLWRSELEPIYQSAVAQVADFLLSDSEKSGPQGFGVSIQGWTTSWELFMDESAISLEGRDQALMRTALAATTAELSDMVSELGTGNAFFNFEPYLGLNLEGLLPTLVARHSNRDWGMSSWQGSYNWPQTIVKLLRQVYFSKRMTWDFRDEFHRSMKLAVELNPNLAIQLEWVFLDPNRPIDWFGPDEELSPTSGIIREMFRDCYSLNIDDLVAKLKIRWALKQLCFGLNSRNDPKDPELKDVPPWCASMFQSIIQAMEVSDLVRHNMIPQMAHIFVGDNRVFRDDLAKLLLGDTKPLFEMVLLEDEPNIEVDPVMGILYRTASLASKQPNGSK